MVILLGPTRVAAASEGGCLVMGSGILGTGCHQPFVARQTSDFKKCDGDS